MNNTSPISKKKENYSICIVVLMTKVGVNGGEND